MRCPTCGRPVRKGQDTCPFCGAFVSGAYLGKAEGGLIIPPDLAKSTQAQPQREFPHEFPREAAEPDLPDLDSLPETPGMPGMRGMEDFEDALPEEEPSARRPEAPSVERPKYARLLRILFPLIFILIPLFNLLVRNSPFSPDERPALQETRFLRTSRQAG